MIGLNQNQKWVAIAGVWAIITITALNLFFVWETPDVSGRINNPLAESAGETIVIGDNDSGNIDNLNLEGVGTVIINNVSPLFFRGFDGGSDGQVVKFIHLTSGDVSVLNSNLNGTQKIYTTNFETMSSEAHGGFSIYYSDIASHWIIYNHALK